MDIFPARGGVVRRCLTRTIVATLIAFFCFFSFSSSISSTFVFAQVPTDTPTPAAPTVTPAAGGTNAQSNVWAFSPEVTEVGRNADRARQLLWWVWTHPGIYHAPIIAQLWGITRNIVYVFIVLVLIAFGIGIMLGRRRGMPGPTFNGITSPLFGMQVPQVFMKLGMILLYVTFSYVIVLGFIQFSEVSMQFIKSLVGRDLFNVFFAGTGNIEANYTTFIGYYNTDQLAREMVSTSMFVIRLTSFTYYTMAVILILRTVILWFLLILSPFLALLMPFVFIRNTGWIWIGVFFQWLFYGPLMTLFVVALVNIWVAGIPYPFDFGRVNKPEGQVYKTSINILYGGPAQTLSSGNSANYVDTFAEYVIALVMLWAAMLLPWLLLRIFRDYCCSMLASANATMSAIFDRMRQYPPPAPPPAPSPTKSGIASQLPFRQSMSDKAPANKYVATARMREISKTSTSEIARAMDLSVSSLKDVSRLEIREKDRGQIRSTLERLAAPERITSSTERERYETVKSELVERARQGDKMAQTMLMASSERRTEMLAKQVAQIHAEKAFAPSVRSAFAVGARSTSSSASTSASMSTSTSRAAMTDRNTISSVSKATNVAEEQVAHVIERAMTSKLMTQSQVQSVAQQSNMSKEKVQEIITAHNTTQSAASTINNETAVREIATSTNTSSEKVREILSSVSEKGNASTQTVKEIAAKTNTSESAVSSIISAATNKQTAIATMSSESAVSEIAKSADVSHEAVRDVLTAVSKSGVVTAQTIKDVAQQTNLSEQKVATIVESSKQAAVLTQAAMTNRNTISSVSKATNVAEEQVAHVIEQAMTSKLMTQSQVQSVAQQSNMSTEKVQEIVTAHNATQSAVSTINNETAVKEIATSTNTSSEKVREVLSSVSEKGNATTQTVKEIAAKTNTSESAVSSIISAATNKQTAIATMSSESAVSEIAKTADVSRDAVRDVLTAVSKSGVVTTQTIKDVAQKTNLSEEKVATIVESSKQATVVATAPPVAATTNVPAAIAAQVGVTEDTVQQVMKEMSAVGPGVQAMKAVAEKVGMPEAKVQEIVAASQQQAATPATAPVSIEEYEDVKGMWLSHYRDAPVPVSETIKDRENWVGDEEKKLTNILNLLTSNQPEMKQRGLEQVAEILPFMLLGGFSETETVGYIQAKLAATQQIKTEIVMKKQIAAEMGAKMEDTMVELPTQRVNVTQTQQTQVRTVEMPVETVDTSAISEAIQQSTQAVTRASIESIRDVTSASTAEITRAMNLMVHSLKDVSHLEIHTDQLQQAQGELANIAQPAAISSESSKQQYTLVREALVERANHGDQAAQVMLLAGEKNTELLVKQILQQTATQAPTTAAIAQKVGVPETTVESVLTALPQAGDKQRVHTAPVAAEQAVKDAAVKTGIEESKVKEIVAAASPVSLEEYEEVRSMWAKHYLQAPVPVTETVKDRQSWINDEERKLTNILNMITSADPAQKQQGMERVAEILPFMLLGGFSETETVAYIQAKLAATQQVKTEIQMQEQIRKEVDVNQEETLITVGGQHAEQVTAVQSQVRSMDSNDRESLQRDVTETVKEALEETTHEMTRASVSAIQNATRKSLSEVTQTMRSMVTSLKELSRLEIDGETRQAVQSTLESIASPQRSPVPEDRQRYEQLHTELVDRSNKGDALAQVMLMTGQKQQAGLIQRAAMQQPLTNKIATSVGVSAEAVQTVLQAVHHVPVAKLIKGEIIVDTESGVPGEPSSLEQTTKALAAKAGIPEGKVKDVLTTATAGVSLDDYEEVKKMWLEHYRNAPVPVSATIKSRHDWLAAEEKKLTNVLNLIVSFNPDLRQQGLSEVAELLPFLLLGGFSDTEMTMYLRAKLEAAQQVKEEIEKVEQAKQEVEGQKENVLVSAANPQEQPAKEQKAEKENSS